MAEEDENLFEEEQPEGGGGGGFNAAMLIRVAVLVATVAVGTVGGYAVGGLFGGSAPADANQAAPPEAAPAPETPTDVANEDFEYVDFERITANLDEARLARYIAATVTLAIRKDKDRGAALARIEKKKPEMRSWLHVYLSGLTLESVRGPKNLNRIRREVEEAFNQLLWPDSRPLIDHVLFKEFAVQ